MKRLYVDQIARAMNTAEKNTYQDVAHATAALKWTVDKIESYLNKCLNVEDGTFVTTLPKSQSTVKLKPMTYGEIMDVQKMAESYPQGRVAPKVTWRLNKQILEINGVQDRSEISKESKINSILNNQ